MFRRLLSWIIPSCPSETRCARFQLYIRRLSWWNDVHIGDIPRLQYSFAGVTTTWSHVIPDRPANKYKEKREELGGSMYTIRNQEHLDGGKMDGYTA